MLGLFGKLLWTKKKTLGQTVAEYALIVSLVAIASITVITAFGNQLRSLYDVMINKIAGKSSEKLEDKTVGDSDVGLEDFQ